MREFRVYVGTFVLDFAATVAAEGPREAWRAATLDTSRAGIPVDIDLIIPDPEYVCDDANRRDCWEVTNGFGRPIGTIVEQ